MIIVLTPEITSLHEQPLIHALFAHGLTCCHIRKYPWDASQMADYIATFDPAYRDRLVLHTHHQRAAEWGIHRLHFSEQDRLAGKHKDYLSDHVCSTSVHCISDFNRLDTAWSYAFLSPVFPSISKPGYGQGTRVLASLKARRQQHTKLIALGGIDATNYQSLYQQGVDGIALMGSIWQAADPLKTFLACKEIDL